MGTPNCEVASTDGRRRPRKLLKLLLREPHLVQPGGSATLGQIAL